MRTSALVAIAVFAVSTASVAQAHHSAVMFDHSRVVSVRGSVKAFEFGSPHSWVALIVPGPGKAVTEWDLEGEDTARLTRDGLTRDTLKPGDKITVGFYQLHDGRPIGQMLYIVAADGKTYGVRPMPPAPR